MQRLLSTDLWPELQRQAKRSRRRIGAVAYATKDLLLLRRGDVLVVDASVSAIRSAATDARLLSTLQRKGVVLHSHPGLHAKVLLFDRVAFVGSSNLSSSSQSALIEAGLLTDSPSTLSQLESFLDQLIARSQRLNRETIRELCRIPVKRAIGPWFGSKRKIRTITTLDEQTWLVGVCGTDRAWTAAEEAELEKAKKKIAAKYRIRESGIDWIRWGSTGAFVKKGRAGHRLIQIWSAGEKTRPSFVYRAASVLQFVQIGRSTFVSIKEPTGKNARIRWGRFKELMMRLGNRRSFGGTSQRPLDQALAEGIDRSWGKF